MAKKRKVPRRIRWIRTLRWLRKERSQTHLRRKRTTRWIRKSEIQDVRSKTQKQKGPGHIYDGCDTMHKNVANDTMMRIREREIQGAFTTDANERYDMMGTQHKYRSETERSKTTLRRMERTRIQDKFTTKAKRHDGCGRYDG